jgi:glycosyltransferase involved in cell wall biosynthesis
MDSLFQTGMERLREAGVKLSSFPMRREPHISDVGALLYLRSYVIRHGPFMLIHAHSSKAGGLARLLRILGGPPVVYTPHTFATLSKNFGKLAYLTYEVAERFLANFTSALIALSTYEAKEAKRLGYQKLAIVHNGIDLAELPLGSRDGVRQEWGIAPDAIVIGFVGRLAPQKAPWVLVDAFQRVSAKYPAALLVMVGDGPLRAKLLEMIQQKGLLGRVLLPGFMEGRRAMRGFDIFALASEYESFGYVLVEAMAEGLPIVTTKVGIAEEIVTEGENGFSVPTGDVEAFARAFDRLISNVTLRRRMGEANRVRVQRLSVDTMIEAILRIYEEVAKGVP